MDYSTLSYDVEEGIGSLTFNRPEVVNAINLQMLDELNSFWEERQEDLNVRVIIIRGSGDKGFCSGLDLKDAFDSEGDFIKKGMTPENIYYTQKSFSKTIRLMRTCPQPIIAAIHGYAMGGGLSFALASDVRLASPDAVFCAQYINIGLGGADVGSSYFLWRIVGWGRAAEMCMTGDRIPANEAYRIGLVNHIYNRDELIDAASSMAKNMITKSPMGLRLTKDAMNAGLNITSLEDANKIEDRNQAYLIAGSLISQQGGPDS
jgi:enoyl-CoA hydratase/carnithine racemase